MAGVRPHRKNSNEQTFGPPPSSPPQQQILAGRQPPRGRRFSGTAARAGKRGAEIAGTARPDETQKPETDAAGVATCHQLATAGRQAAARVVQAQGWQGRGLFGRRVSGRQTDTSARVVEMVSED